jgi:hypothetical protein
MTLTGKQKEILREFILKTYREGELEILLSEKMGINYEATKRGDTYKNRVYYLIVDLEASGKIIDFIITLIEKKPNNYSLKWITKIIISTLILGLIIIPIADKLDNSTKLTIFNCEGISLKIPQNWHNDGAQQKCQAIAYGIDATITPKSFQENEIKAPKVILIVDDIYEPEITLRDFYKKQKQEAEKLIRQTNSSLTLNPSREFKNHDAFELIYNYTDDQVTFKRKDIGFIHEGKQYIIRYEASIRDFPKYEQEAKKIIYSLDFIPQ